MTSVDQLNKAKTLGKDSFHAGKQSAPCLSAELMTMLEGREVGNTPANEATSIEIMRSYANAWHHENLSQIVH